MGESVCEYCFTLRPKLAKVRDGATDPIPRDADPHPHTSAETSVPTVSNVDEWIAVRHAEFVASAKSIPNEPLVEKEDVLASICSTQRIQRGDQLIHRTADTVQLRIQQEMKDGIPQF